MRIYLKTSQSKTLLSFEYQNKLTAALHRWLDYDSEIHDNLSLYSFSWLSGGKPAGKKGLRFEQGAEWFISSPDMELIKRLIHGIQKDPWLMEDFYIEDVLIRSENQNIQSEKHRFFVASPVLVKGKDEHGNIKHYSFDDEKTSLLLTQTLKTKLQKAGREAIGNIKVYFDSNYPQAKTKVADYKGIKNKGNLCPIIIEADPEIIQFAWAVGAGNSTGIGFGALV